MKSKQDRYETGDQGTKEFYKQFKENREKTYIYQLENDQSQIVSTTPEILNTTFEFFTKLFKEKPNDPQLEKKFLNGITANKELKKKNLTKPITKTELLCTIKEMATGKTRGPDGIAIEFYHKYWHIIENDFTQVLNEIHEKGIIPDEIKSAIITLVQKKNIKEDHRNYRPVSLLNRDLKIYTKILANRFQIYRHWNRKNRRQKLEKVIGTAKKLDKNWKKKLKEFRNETVKLSSHVMTWNAKALLSETKILPLITYTSSTYINPTKIKENLRKTTEQFMSGSSKITIPFQTLALPQRHGGFNVANITLYADLFLIRHTQKYCKHRAEETPITPI